MITSKEIFKTSTNTKFVSCFSLNVQLIIEHKKDYEY